MNPALALHTAARRYCDEQHGVWTERYARIVAAGRDRKSNDYHYTPEAYNTFPRYNVLNAIRVEVERIDSEELPDLAETRELVLLAGAIANDAFTEKPSCTIAAEAMEHEREKFSSHIQGLTETDLMTVAPLPYRKVLSEAESESMWSELRARWQIPEGYWFPLAKRPSLNVEAFQDQPFREFLESFDLPGLLASKGVSRVWEFREYGPEYEQDVMIFYPYYDAEGYWSSEGMDWIVYASHENSITVGGWLLDEIKEKWPEWQERIWLSPFF